MRSPRSRRSTAALLDAARTLGAGPGADVFFRVALPLAVGGLGAGAALAFARGIGEFGATIMFAGSLQGVTQTLSLAIYEQFDVDFDVALAIGALLVVVSGALLLAVKLVPRMDALLSLDVSAALRTFVLELSARGRRGDGRARRARRARARRPCCARSPGSCGRSSGRIALGDEMWFDAGARARPPTGGARRRATSSRTTRSSRT